MSLFASILFWVLIWVGRNELESKWKWFAILAWFVGIFVAQLVPTPSYLFMAWVAILDISLILAIFGGDLVIR